MPNSALLECNGSGRCATPGLRAPPRCATEPTGLKFSQDSNHPWVKVGAQVTSNTCTPHGAGLPFVGNPTGNEVNAKPVPTASTEPGVVERAFMSLAKWFEPTGRL